MAIAKDWYHTEIKNDDMEILHRSPSVEYSFYNAVRSGDMETVTANCKNDSFLHLEGTGVLSRNPLTNIKYHFVVTTAMLTRYCIDGGLEPEQAYRLSDFYILKMDSCTSVREVADLHHIYSHIKERITIQDLAEHTGLSCNYLSRIFKQNLGVSISDYIREQKIEKATHLLRYSDQSIVDIAAYLSFSSQSHFIQIFEGYIGLTPKKYRDKYYKSMR